MSMLKFTSFGGEVPRLTKRNLPDNSAQEAGNLLADTNEFRPLPEDVEGSAISFMAVDQTCKTLYRYPSNSENLAGAELAMKVERSQIIDDQYDRVYVSMIKGETEYAPKVMIGTGSLDATAATLKPLGAKYPTVKPTLALLTGTTFLSPTGMESEKGSILAQIKAIVQQSLEFYWWNPQFDAAPLSVARGFRESPFVTPSPTGNGIWQRVFGVYAANAQSDITPGTWVTFNGSALERHLWMTQVQNPAHHHYGTTGWMTGSGSTNRAYYADFNAKVLLWKIKADVTVQVTALQQVFIPGTTTPVLSAGEISGLFAVLRAWLPANPMDIPSADAQQMLTRFTAAYSQLIPVLENGDDTAVEPAMTLQKLTGWVGELQSVATSLAQAFETFATTQFDESLAAYMQETRFDGKFPDGETAIVEPRFYTYTFVNSRGEESKPYAPGDGNDDTEFEIMEVNQQQGVSVTRPSVDAGDITAHDLSKWRIYRSATSTTTSMMLAAELPIATTVFTDNLLTEQLNEVLTTSSWYPPPVYSSGGDAVAVQNFAATGANTYRYLKGIVAMPGGFMAGYLDNSVYFSEAYYAYAWPPEYAIPCTDDIRALGVFGNTLVVLTNGRVSFISGSSPDGMQKIDIETVESCASARSVVPVSGGVIFASHNGLCVASQQGVQNMTAQLFTRDEWQAIQPNSLICEEMDGVVYFTQDGGAPFMGALHVPTGKLVRIDTQVTAMYSDYKNGRLYLAYPPETGEIAKAYAFLEHQELYRTAHWRSKRIVLEKETGFAWMAVEGTQSTDNPLNVDIYGYLTDSTGTEVETKLTTATDNGTYSAVVTDTRPIRVGVGRFKDFEVEIRGQCRINSVLFASSTAELQGVN